jgi:hypothetical protein
VQPPGALDAAVLRYAGAKARRPRASPIAGWRLALLEAMPFFGMALSAVLLLSGKRLEIAARFPGLGPGIVVGAIKWEAK